MSLRRACWVVALATAVWCAVAIPARATYGARTTGDEPHYLLTALSLAEDHNLDVSDETAAGRWRAFHGVALPVQAEPLERGQMLSPHDPLLPAVLAVPMGIGGWMAAKAMLAVLAGALAAALVWVAHRRFAVPIGVASVVVLAFALAAPLSAYGTQVYPELPAALAVTIAVAALTGPLRSRGLWCAGACVIALPWLSVKYALVAAALAAVVVVRLLHRPDRRPVAAFVGGLAVSAVAYLVLHKVVYGGWTVYAAGDHFVAGEFTVVGSEPNYGGRARRLLGLLVDRNFGLIAWAPVFVLALPALGTFLRRRPAGSSAVVLPLAAGWLTATFVAQTMHGWWWPGRQVVVVVPCLVLMVCWFAARVRWARIAAIVLGVLSAMTWAWLVAEVLRLDLRLIIDFDRTSAPVHQALRAVLPDMAAPARADWALFLGWTAAAAVLLVIGWRAESTHHRQEKTNDHPITPNASRAGRLAAAAHSSVR